MKLKFDKNLEYQQQAIASVVDLFRGQTPMHTNFTVSAYNGQIGLFDTETTEAKLHVVIESNFSDNIIDLENDMDEYEVAVELSDDEIDILSEFI